MSFNGFVGAVTLPPGAWTKVGNTTPLTGDMFTVTVSTLYSPGFLTRSLNESKSTEFTKNSDGIRKCLSEEFSSLYIINLRGNSIGASVFTKKEGGNIFDIRIGVAIAILVKNPNNKNKNYENCILIQSAIK